MRKDPGLSSGGNKQQNSVVLTINSFKGTRGQMALSKEEAIDKARKDMAQRLRVGEGDIAIQSAEDAEFPDTALGASTEDEMSGQMITPGWRIRLQANDQMFEYRANKHYLRLYNYKGANYRI